MECGEDLAVELAAVAFRHDLERIAHRERRAIHAVVVVQGVEDIRDGRNIAGSPDRRGARDAFQAIVSEIEDGVARSTQDLVAYLRVALDQSARSSLLSLPGLPAPSRSGTPILPMSCASRWQRAACRSRAEPDPFRRR